MSDGPTVRSSVERHLDALPILPAVIAQLMTLDRADDDYADRVVELIGAEPNFSARVIAAANSAASAPRSPITTLGPAVARIGSVDAANLVVAVGVSRVFVPRDRWERSLWRHALQVAFAARSLVAHARPDGINPDEAYLVGLLHDMGRFVLFAEAPDKLREVDEGDWDTPQGLLDLEVEICGIDHAELGALACEKWSIPRMVGDAVATHHAAPAAPTDTVGRLAAIVAFADLAMFPSAMASADGYAAADLDTIADELHPLLPDDLAMSAERLHRIIIDVTEEAEATLGVLGL